MHERRFNPEDVYKLEDPERLEWMPPDELVSRVGLAPGMVVADIGAGTGFFSIPVAKAVAPGGRVLAADVSPELLKLLAAKLDARDAPRNIELFQGEATHTELHTGSCDVALLANIWHELDDRATALREAARILKPTGRLAVLDWRPDGERPPGPPLEHRVGLEQVVTTLRDNGWRVLGSDAFGRYSYLVIARRPAQ